MRFCARRSGRSVSGDFERSIRIWPICRTTCGTLRTTCGTATGYLLPGQHVVRLDWSPPLDRARAKCAGSLVRKLSFAKPKARVRVWARPSPRKSRKFNKICKMYQDWCAPGQFLAAPYHMLYASYHMLYAVRRVVCSPALFALCAGCSLPCSTAILQLCPSSVCSLPPFAGLEMGC